MEKKLAIYSPKPAPLPPGRCNGEALPFRLAGPWLSELLREAGRGLNGCEEVERQSDQGVRRPARSARYTCAGLRYQVTDDWRECL